mmetsp:Transcript_12897/g.30603  ORF Transcript_12897/g.30603 Transcript_12897/m.30603 type:complete len:97 (+) Transcript_12897:1627-1917(+)
MERTTNEIIFTTDQRNTTVTKHTSTDKRRPQRKFKRKQRTTSFFLSQMQSAAKSSQSLDTATHTSSVAHSECWEGFAFWLVAIRLPPGERERQSNL